MNSINVQKYIFLKEIFNKFNSETYTRKLVLPPTIHRLYHKYVWLRLEVGVLLHNDT